jgi:hypothetical protein
MENEVKTWHVLVFTAMITAMIFMIYDKPQIAYDNFKTNCEDDSLKSVISSLQAELEQSYAENDKMRNKYEEIIFEYSYGLEHLKKYDLSSYREFHRIIGYREEYSMETEKENKKRLKL